MNLSEEATERRFLSVVCSRNSGIRPRCVDHDGFGTDHVLLAISIIFVLFFECLFSANARVLIEPTGPEQIVFLHSREACMPEDVPDEPARAFRDAAGRVHLFASNFVNFESVGPSLNDVKRDCVMAFRGKETHRPKSFDNREWLTSFWSSDGINVFALIHNEFHGTLRPGLCPSGVYNNCWYNSVIAAVSHDGGYHFARAGIVAAPAYRYNLSLDHPVGYFNPSNVIKRNGYFYTFAWAESVGEQKRGNCLLRTNNLRDPGSWRAWGGKMFNVRFGNPYLKAPSSGAPLVCAVIDPQHLSAHIWSLVIYAPMRRYIALSAIEKGPTQGFYMAESGDLVHWTEPQLIRRTAAQPSGCANVAQRTYPSLLDANSRSRNFDTIGNTAFIYFTEFHSVNCRVGLDRDLLRLPVGVKRSP